MSENRKKIKAAISCAAKKFLDDIHSICFEENDETLFTSDSSSDDSDDESVIKACLILAKRKSTRTYNYVENIIPNYLDGEFKQHFRLSRSAFGRVLGLVAANIKEERRARIDLEKQLLAVLWFLATPDSFRSIGDRFDIAKSSLSLVFVRIINALNKIAPTTIRWPSATEMSISKETFKEIGGIDNIIGVIDGTYVRIKPPADQYQSYTNRKMFQSMTLQAVCDQKMKFLHCFTGFPSSVHDSRIFKNSDFYESVLSDRKKYFPTNEIILGDKAYPLLPWLITPYIDRGGITQAQKRFNKQHALARQVIERSFAHLFGRFRRLKMLDIDRIHWVPATILACCVMHNICIECNDSLEEFISEGSTTAEECSTTEDESCTNNPAGYILRQQITSTLM